MISFHRLLSHHFVPCHIVASASSISATFVKWPVERSRVYKTTITIRGNVRHAASDIVQCIQAHVDYQLEFSTVEIRCVVLATMEERHADVMAITLTRASATGDKVAGEIVKVHRNGTAMSFIQLATCGIASVKPHVDLMSHIGFSDYHEVGFTAYRKTRLYKTCRTDDKKWIRILEASNVSMGDLCAFVFLWQGFVGEWKKPISY